MWVNARLTRRVSLLMLTGLVERLTYFFFYRFPYLVHYSQVRIRIFIFNSCWLSYNISSSEVSLRDRISEACVPGRQTRSQEVLPLHRRVSDRILIQNDPVHQRWDSKEWSRCPLQVPSAATIGRPLIPLGYEVQALLELSPPRNHCIP